MIPIKGRFICVLLFTVASLQGAAAPVRAQPAGANLPSAHSIESDQKSLWQHIDTRFSGRFKTTTAVARATDDTFYEPVGTGMFYDGGMNFRLINETFFGETLVTEVDYEVLGVGGDSIRKQQELAEIFPNFQGNVFFGGAPLEDDRRLMDLTHAIVEEDSYFLLHRLDRLLLTLNQPWGSVRIGRQAVTWGNGFVFNPMDLFNPFPPAAIDRDYKVGDDMATVQLAIPTIGNLQGLYVVRRNPDNHQVASDQSSLAGKLHVAALGTTEFDLMTARHFDDYVGGIGTTGYLGDSAWRLDGTWTFLKDGGDYLSLVANLDYAWVWFGKNFYGFIEYYFNGLGKDDYAEALLDPDITERLDRGELFVLGRNYLSGHLQVELHPLFRVSFTAISNIADPSGILQPYATWDITQNLQLTGGINVFYGSKGSEYGGFIIPGTDVRSRSPNSAYLWLTYHF